MDNSLKVQDCQTVRFDDLNYGTTDGYIQKDWFVKISFFFDIRINLGSVSNLGYLRVKLTLLTLSEKFT